MSPEDAVFARRMLYASICAYNITGDEHDPQPVEGASRVVPSADGYTYSVVDADQREVGFAGPPESYTPAFFADGKHDVDAALAGLTADGYAVIALRGTLPPSLHGSDLLQWVDDWANDAHIKPVDWAVDGTPMGKAETGFSESSLRLWPWIKAQVAELLPDAPNGVVITGHSKGAAMCYLIASLVQNAWPELTGKIAVHAFAPAASVNQRFVEAYDAAGLSAQTHRYIVAHDIVPFLPDWQEANIWTGMHFEGLFHEAEWLAIGGFVGMETDGGYSAPGRLHYFGADYQPVAAEDALEQALAAVIEELKDGKFDIIGAAHSITGSYALCFPPVEPAPPQSG